MTPRLRGCATHTWPETGPAQPKKLNIQLQPKRTDSFTCFSTGIVGSSKSALRTALADASTSCQFKCPKASSWCTQSRPTIRQESRFIGTTDSEQNVRVAN